MTFNFAQKAILAGCLLTGALLRRVGHARAHMILSALIVLSNAAVGAGMSALGMFGQAGAQATPGAEPTSNVWTPPEDAAPLEEQVWHTYDPVAVPSAEGVITPASTTSAAGSPSSAGRAGCRARRYRRTFRSPARA